MNFSWVERQTNIQMIQTLLLYTFKINGRLYESSLFKIKTIFRLWIENVEKRSNPWICAFLLFWASSFILNSEDYVPMKLFFEISIKLTTKIMKWAICDVHVWGCKEWIKWNKLYTTLLIQLYWNDIDSASIKSTEVFWADPVRKWRNWFTPKNPYVQFSSCVIYVLNFKYLCRTVFEIPWSQETIQWRPNRRTSLLIPTKLPGWLF